MFTFNRTIYEYVLFKCKSITFHVSLGSKYILVSYILRNIEKKLFVTSVTKVHGLGNHQRNNT